MTDAIAHLNRALEGRYTARRCIGSGGMATVYLADDLRHRRSVALKVLRPEIAATLGAARFLREIEVTAGLRHPHILPLLDSGEADGVLYYVMPYVEGESLRDRLTRERQLPVDEAVKIGAEVADALGYAHSRGVVHRDIKPENILLEAGHAVVADFGVARAITAVGDDRLTETGLVVGTPAYLSPEQVAGEREIDGRSDVYALGCVLHEMLVGEPPITGPSVAAILARKSIEAPAGVRRVREAVPPEIERTIQRALAVVPADRQRTATDLAAELTRFMGSERGLVAWHPGRRWMRIGAIAASIPILAVLAIWRPWASRPAGIAPTDAARVMVLPYDNRTGDGALAPIGDMVAEWVTEGLLQTGQVQVVPHFMVLEAVNAARRGGGAVALEPIARITRSEIAVTGSYYRHGGILDFHSEVVDVRTGRAFVTVDPVSGPAADPRGAIESVRAHVMGALATRLSPLAGWELPPNVRPPNYEASQAYSRGMAEWIRTDYRAAAEWFERAYRLDTTYLRSLMLAMAGHNNAGESSVADSLTRVIVARRSELAPYDRYRLDYLIAIRAGDIPAALENARAGATLVPFGTIHGALILTLVSVNRPREALTYMEQVAWQMREIAGTWSVTWDAYTTILHLLGDHDRELELAREARGRVQGELYSMTYTGRALAALGRLDELRALGDEMAAASKTPSRTPAGALFEVAEEARAHGHLAAARELAQRALDWSARQPDSVNATAAAHMTRGRLLYLLENWQAAVETFRDPRALAVDPVSRLGYDGTIAARRGDTAAARHYADSLARPGPSPFRGAATLWRARIAAVLGERDNAVALLRQAFDEGLGFGLWVHRDIDFESLRSYPPFVELTKPQG